MNKKSNSKASLIEKVNSEVRPQPQKLNSNNKPEVEKIKPKKIKGKKSNFFFFKLSKISQIMFIVYIGLIIFFGSLFVMSFLNKGEPIIGKRNLPVKVISNDDVAKVKKAIEQSVDADKVDVSLNAFRFVVVMDLGNDTTAVEGRAANIKAYKAINSILPVSEYFSSTTKLNNDLFIYSTDLVPTNYETNSKYIYQTYKNSKMVKAKSYDILKARDAKSQKEVLETFKQAQK